MTTAHVIIHGRVQGVSFRAWTVEQAKRLMLSGWVRNLADGTMETVFHGTPEAVQEMLLACQKGPEAARVEKVELLKDVPTFETGKFVQLRTV